jgi:hypothetical protein
MRRGKKFARLENEKSQLVLLVNKYNNQIQSLFEFIRTIKNRHADEMRNLRNKCEVEKNTMRKRMRDMRDEILSLQELKRKRARRMAESTGSEDVEARGVENTPCKKPSSLGSVKPMLIPRRRR